MAIAVLDPVGVPVAPAAPTRRRTRRRPPATVLAAAGLAALESLGLLAAGLSGFGDLLDAGVRPSAGVVLTSVVVLAGWVVCCAAGGASLVDRSGRRLLVVVSVGEFVLLAGLLVAGLTTGLPGVPAGTPLPALALLGAAVPSGKLLLAGAPTAAAWLAEGPRPRAARPTPREPRTRLRLATLAVLGAGLAVLAVAGPAAPQGAGTDVPAATAGAR